MNPSLIQQATLGTSDAWTLLLRAGAEAFLDDVRTSPVQTKLEDVDFCEQDANEPLSEREIDAALNLLRFSKNSEVCVVTLDRSNKRFPAERVVDFMSRVEFAGDERKTTFQSCARVCGNVGRWLAKYETFRHDLSLRLPPLFHAETLAPEQAKIEAERLWRNARSTNERTAALKALRRVDPNEARELLDAVFLEEKPDVRVAFLNATSVNLSESDAPFLEKALKSKSAECKRVALLLLCKIPTSPHALAMRERAELVAAGETPEYDEDCKIAQFPDDDRRLAFSVAQAVPLRYWTEERNYSPERLAERYPFEEKTEPLYFGWAQAFLNEIYDVNRKSELDAPQAILDSYPNAFEWLDFFFDLWRKVDAAGAFPRVKWEKSCFPKLIDWELSLAACDPHTAREKGLIQGVGIGSYDHNQWIRRIECEPKPYSEEFTNKYLNRLAFKNPDVWDVSLASQMIYFTPEARKKIVQT
ncbi:MAG: hypothetical protein J6X44_10450, partial [Thermoguttaceae bacterium]|nr:hypothetical protein [Thermoguttaceae bacterium]